MACLPVKVLITPMVMGSRRETMARAKTPARNAERVEMAGAVVMVAAVAAEVTPVIRIGDLFTPAAAEAPEIIVDAPEGHDTRKKSSNALLFQVAKGSERGKIPSTKT